MALAIYGICFAETVWKREVEQQRKPMRRLLDAPEKIGIQFSCVGFIKSENLWIDPFSCLCQKSQNRL